MSKIKDYIFNNIQNIKSKPEQVMTNLIEGLEISRPELVLMIRKFLWMEIDEIEIHPSKVILFSITGYEIDEFDLIDIKVLLNKFEQENLVKPIDVLSVIYYFHHEKIESVDDWVNIVRMNMNEYGCNIIPIETILEFYSTYSDIDISKFNSLISKSKSIRNRPEYISEVIENSNVEDLEDLDHWVSFEHKERIIDEVIDQELSEFKDWEYESAIEYFDNNPFLSKFPLSFKVLKDRIANLPAKTIEMEDMSDIPQDLIRSWSPKYVYSNPDLIDEIEIYFPGGPHIGHSAIIIKTNQFSFLMDYGMSVVNNSIPKWDPLLSKLDFVLISHAHMDHSGSLPILLGNDRKLPWFATKETRIMTEMLWYDTKNIVERSYSQNALSMNKTLQRLTDEGSIINTLQNFYEMEVNKSYDLLPGLSIKTYDSAHLFGSVGFELKINGRKLLYTGDFKADKGVDFPTDCDVTIFDGTYFERYTEYEKPEIGLENALKNSDRILIPAFSMGRSHEMLFKLKELGAEKDWKIYLTGMGGRLASKLNLTLGSSGGGKKAGVSIVPSIDEEDFVSKTIVIGGQGMLQAGTSRRLFDYSKDDPDTSVILCGYQAPNTMGYHLLNENKYLLEKYKQQVKRVKISGHSTGESLDTFLDNIDNDKIMVHSPLGALENRKRSSIIEPPSTKPFTI